MPALWQHGMTVPQEELRCHGDCSWHSAGDGSTGDLSRVVNGYNVIGDESALLSLFTSLEVTLLRGDRQMWPELQTALLDKFRSGLIVILNGKPAANKWLHISCVLCGRYVFLPYPTSGWNQMSEEHLANGKQKLFTFFMLPHRAQHSQLHPEV